MSNQQRWQQIALRTTRKVNTAWWLQVVSTPLVLCALIITCGILLMRRTWETLPYPTIALCAGALILITSISCWLIARRHFESQQQAYVRIDAAMRLRNALTAANQKVTAWPEVPVIVHDGTEWHWPRLLSPLLATTLIISSGFLIPIEAKSSIAPPAQQPAAWNELDASLSQLDQQDIVQEEYLDAMRKKLEELRDQSPDEWFSHSSLEATDNLKENHHSEQNQLRRNLQRAEHALGKLQSQSAAADQAQKQRLLKEFDQAVQKMQQNQMQPNRQLLEQLKNIDPEQLKQLSPEQLEQIRQNMRRHAQGLSPSGQYPSDEANDDWLNEKENDQEGDAPGRGGIDRGPGTAPQVLGNPHEDTGTGKHQGLESRDLSRALPSDLLQTSDAQHQVNRTRQNPSEGGSSHSKGQGGDRVWKNSLLPNEKKAIKKFFE